MDDEGTTKQDHETPEYSGGRIILHRPQFKKRKLGLTSLIPLFMGVEQGMKDTSSLESVCGQVIFHLLLATKINRVTC